MLKSLTIRGFAMNDMVADAAVRRAAIAFVRQGFIDGRLKPVIDKVFDLDDIAQAHRYLESNVQLGKIVVRTS
jgi:NADPH:quinone reductase-like Zn-dependent oxidoreductase